MSAWPFNILPLIERLAQDKPIASGLLVGADCGQDAWPADWQHCPPAQLVAEAATLTGKHLAEYVG